MKIHLRAGLTVIREGEKDFDSDMSFAPFETNLSKEELHEIYLTLSKKFLYI